MNVKHRRNCCGNAVLDVLVLSGILIFVLLPLFAVIMEKYIVFCKAQSIKDSVDITNASTYISLKAGMLGMSDVDFDEKKALEIFKDILCSNLGLDEDLDPSGNSLADGRVMVNSLEFYLDGFPVECPKGSKLVRPSIHSCISVPVKPGLFGGVLLKHSGREFYSLDIHVDTDIPIDN